MRFVLFAGSRDYPDLEQVRTRVWDEAANGPFVLVAGKAQGVDLAAREAATRVGMYVVDVPVEEVHWQTFGRAAGHKRNAVMLELPLDLAVYFIKDKSSGSMGCLEGATRKGIPTEVHHWTSS